MPNDSMAVRETITAVHDRGLESHIDTQIEVRSG